MEVYLHRTFVKRLKKAPERIQIGFNKRIELFINNPTDPSLNNHSVERAYPDCRSINISGDYRAIYKTEGDTAIFINIGTHSELY